MGYGCRTSNTGFFQDRKDGENIVGKLAKNGKKERDVDSRAILPPALRSGGKEERGEEEKGEGASFYFLMPLPKRRA